MRASEREVKRTMDDEEIGEASRSSCLVYFPSGKQLDFILPLNYFMFI